MYDRFVGMATAVWLLLLWPLLLWPLGFLAELDTWFIDLVVGLVLGFLLFNLDPHSYPLHFGQVHSCVKERLLSSAQHPTVDEIFLGQK